MLKKLFPGGPHHQPGASAGPPSVLKHPRTTAAGQEEWDQLTGFTRCLQQLDEFEARLRDTLCVLTRHCQAITEMCVSTVAFTEQLGSLLCENPSSGLPRPSEEAVGLVNMFRVSTIAPLQGLLITVPQLRLRSGHRTSALRLLLRYQHKVREMESKSKSESARLQRNRAKLQAATARFRELDAHVQQEIRTLVARDLTETTKGSLKEVLLRAQMLVGQTATDDAARLSTLMETQQPEESCEHVGEAPETNEPVEKTEETPTAPQRRMAMTVLTEAVDNNVHVRQSILSPPPAPRAPVASRSSRSAATTHTASAATTEDEHDDEAESETNDETDSTVADIHEDFGVARRKKHVRGSRTWEVHQHIKDNLFSSDGFIDLADCVRLPDGFARDEWIAGHVVDFYNEINLLYGTISECCTSESCPQMSAGPCYTYMWADSASSAAEPLPASQYVARLMDWINTQINDPLLFPTDASISYAADFEVQTAAVILKRLFRVYAHMYHSHLEHFAQLGVESHLGFCFKRFVFFIKEFQLVAQKELNALRKLVLSMLESPLSDLRVASIQQDAVE